MEFLRYSRDVYGQQVLEGISWDLLWPLVGLSAAIIIGHFVYMQVKKAKTDSSSL